MTPIPAHPYSVLPNAQEDPTGFNAMAAKVIENSNQALRRLIEVQTVPGPARDILGNAVLDDWEARANEITRKVKG